MRGSMRRWTGCVAVPSGVCGGGSLLYLASQKKNRTAACSAEHCDPPIIPWAFPVGLRRMRGPREFEELADNFVQMEEQLRESEEERRAWMRKRGGFWRIFLMT